MSFYTRRNIKLLLLVFFVFNAFLFAQNQEFIVGKLVDANTEEPIAFASIRIKNKALGVISNIDGSFKIPIKLKTYGDVVKISSMGYESRELLMSSFLLEDVNIVKLATGIFKLEETLVIGSKKTSKLLSAKKIVQKSIERILENYPITPYSQIGYYRDYQLDESEYVNLNEAILEVFDQGFDESDVSASKVKIYQYNQNNLFKRDSLAIINYNYKTKSKIIPNAYLGSFGGNEFVILTNHNAIRNYKLNTYDFVNRLEIDLIKNHNLERVEDAIFMGNHLYTIKFKKKTKKIQASGLLYISKKDYAIHKLEYSLYKTINKKSKGEKTIIFKVIIEYKSNSSKMYLNYISLFNKFQLTTRVPFIVEEIFVNDLCHCFEIHFNKNIDALSAGNLANYDIRFKKKRLEFRNIVIFDNAVRIYPDMEPKNIKKMFNRFLNKSEKDANTKQLFEAQITGVKSNLKGENYLLGHSKIKNYNQYREFFVQRIKPSVEKVSMEGSFMDKSRPIFKNQPTMKPKNFGDYWMNTPLIKSEN